MIHARTGILTALLVASISVGSRVATAQSASGLRAAEDSGVPPYILGIGDVLEIKFFFTPELNQTVTVRPDGKVSLQLIEDMPVAGLRPKELTRALTERYSAYLKKPEVAVILKELGEQSIYVGGEVANPHLVPLKGGLTALQAIFSSGGFRASAHTSNVLIIRRSDDGAPIARTMNLKKAMSGQDMKQDLFLQAFDIIYVPKSRIGRVNQFVDQYINNIIPRSVVFGGFSYVRYTGQQTTALPSSPR